MASDLLMFCYIGPGGALSAIGSALALLGAVVLAVLGFIWYPIKRLLRGRRERQQERAEARATSAAPERGVEA